MATYSQIFELDDVALPQPDPGYSAIVDIDGVLLQPPSGTGWVIVAGLPWPGDALSILDEADPAAEPGDVIEWDLVTSPGAFDVTMRPDGTFVLDDSDDGTQQTFQYRLWRSASGWTEKQAVTMLGDDEPGLIAESSAFGALFSPSVRASALWSDGFSASDSRSAVAHATASIVEGMAAGDDSSNVLETLREIAAGATGDAVMDAFGQAVAAVLAGVQAGEQWAMDILSAGSLSSGVSLSDFWSADTADSVSRAINAGSVAAAHFSFAAGVLAALTEGASVGDAFGAVAQIIAEISEAVFAGDAWSTADISARLIQAGAAAGDLWSGVTSQVIYSLTAGVAAGSVLLGISRSAAILSAPAFASSQFSARIAGQGSFSVGAITITAAIRAAINLR